MKNEYTTDCIDCLRKIGFKYLFNPDIQILEIFKNPRNSREIRTLASQITPKTLELLAIYQTATKEPYSYVLINLTQEGLPQLKYTNNIFSKTHVVNVYVSSSCK